MKVKSKYFDGTVVRVQLDLPPPGANEKTLSTASLDSKYILLEGHETDSVCIFAESNIYPQKSIRTCASIVYHIIMAESVDDDVLTDKEPYLVVLHSRHSRVIHCFTPSLM